MIFAILFFGAFGYFCYRFYIIWGYIRLGAEPVDSMYDEPLARIKNVFTTAFIQPKMFRDFIPGLMHALIFWGFILVTIGTTETIMNGFVSTFTFERILPKSLFHVFLVSQDIANAWVALAIVVAIYRRLAKSSSRLNSLASDSRKDAYVVLGWIFALVVTALLTIGAKARMGEYSTSYVPVSTFLTGLLSFGTEHWKTYSHFMWWIHIAALLGFLVYLPNSKHQHFIWAIPNIFFQSLKKRGRLKPMEFSDDAESFGVGKVEEFSWKQLLDGYTCVECGRCQEVCPAYNTGKPLDPRKIVHDIKYSLLDSVGDSEANKPLIKGFISEEELWACTTCGACMEACPLSIEHIPSIVDMRRYQTMTMGEHPDELEQTFNNLETNFTPWSGVDHSTRADWAKDEDITTYAEDSDVEYCFWVGCAGSYDDRYKKVSKSIAKVMKKAGVSFSILGTEEKCNGDTARRLGNEYLAQQAITENVETMKKHSIKKIVTGCPHCFNTIKNEYPDFGYKAEVVHHTQLFKQLIDDGKIKSTQVPKDAKDVTFHDSCYLGRHNDEYESPRDTLEETGVKLTEMPRSKEDGFCCGAGGGRMWLEEDTGTMINENRAEEAIATNADTVATSCPFCMTMMQDGIKTKGHGDKVQVKDVAEILAESMDL